MSVMSMRRWCTLGTHVSISSNGRKRMVFISKIVTVHIQNIRSLQLLGVPPLLILLVPQQFVPLVELSKISPSRKKNSSRGDCLPTTDAFLNNARSTTVQFSFSITSVQSQKISHILFSNDFPPVNSTTRARSQGVTSFPLLLTPFSSDSRTA